MIDTDFTIINIILYNVGLISSVVLNSIIRKIIVEITIFWSSGKDNVLCVGDCVFKIRMKDLLWILNS